MVELYIKKPHQIINKHLKTKKIDFKFKLPYFV
jgi:hypothetical protein